MADRSSIFIDAGYLLAAGGLICCGTRDRSQFVCDYERLTTDLAEWVRDHSGGMVSLRTYWYDGAKHGIPTAEQERIGGLAYVKVRLGRVHSGQQKGVDALIYRDLMTLARERAIARAYLLSGDEDLREGVVAAQDMGVQVVLIGVPTSQRANQSAVLIREADEHVVLPRKYWASYFGLQQSEISTTASITPERARAAGRAFAVGWVKQSTPEDLAKMLKASPRIPGDIDYALMTETEKTLGSLRTRQDLKHELRAGFWAALDQQGSALE